MPGRLSAVGAGGLLAVLAGAGAVAQRGHMRRIAADPEHCLLSAPPVGRPLSVCSRDGTRLHVECFGPDEGPTIVLAHGWTESLSYWIYVTRELSHKGFRVVAYDLRGHGRSERATAGDYSLTRFGEDIEAVLEGCVPEGQRAVLAGHSLGAMSIAAWAEHHEVQARISAAALLNTGVGDLIAEQLLYPVPRLARAMSQAIAVRGFLGARTTLSQVSTPISHAIIRYVAFGPSSSPAQVAFYERMLVTCLPDVRAAVGLAMSVMDLHDAVPRLTVPTLVMAGCKDRLTPASHARLIAQVLPVPAGLVELPETGHMGPLERPLEISQALAALADGVAQGAEDAGAARAVGTAGAVPGTSAAGV